MTENNMETLYGDTEDRKVHAEYQGVNGAGPIEFESPIHARCDILSGVALLPMAIII